MDAQVCYGRVLSAFDARPVAGGRFWKARCPRPVCDQKRRLTLHFWVADDGRLIARCWRCGRMTGAEGGAFLREIAQSRGLAVTDFFPDNDQNGKKEYVRPRLAATYAYEDADGRPAHRTLRFEPKSFAQERWDAERKKWVAGLGPHPEHPRYLFRLPRLLADPTGQVVVVEGEKKVLLLESWGLLATCNAGGAGMGWLDDYSAWLRGRDVALLPDNNAPGYRHADLVAGSLLRHRVASLRVVLLPGLGPGEDVADWAAAGRTREEFLVVLGKTPCWRVP